MPQTEGEYQCGTGSERELDVTEVDLTQPLLLDVEVLVVGLDEHMGDLAVPDTEITDADGHRVGRLGVVHEGDDRIVGSEPAEGNPTVATA